MLIARFTTGEDPRFGVVEGPEIAAVAGDPLYTPIQFTGERVALDDARLLAPVIPRSKVLGIGRNYAEHAAELGNDVPAEPLVFLKPNTSVVGPGDPIVLPAVSRRVDYEGELAVVIGRVCRDVPRERVNEVVLGYTCANDVTARDLQNRDGQWWRAKGYDSFCPLGPYLATGIDPSDLRVTTRLDGRTVQDGRTSQMVHDVPSIVAFVSSAMTLLPGDVILTGTPAGVGPMESGSRMEVEVEGIGVLQNTAVRR
ncbi:MAG: fumarylacetoacetate hydrolase family protein [Kineosporiaceae bacterium]